MSYPYPLHGRMNMVRTRRNGFMTFVILGLSLAALSMTVAFSRSASAELGCQAVYAGSGNGIQG